VSGRRGLRAWLGDRSGATILEFAIVSPALILILAGLAQYAWTQHCASSLRYALATSSRNLLLNPNMTQTAFSTLVKSHLTQADPNVTVTLAVATANGQKLATATGTYSHSINLIVAPAIPVTYRTSVVTALPPM
jgi:Flp pilus assembly protein TadG